MFSRRKLLKYGSLAIVSPIALPIGRATAQTKPAAGQRLEETDPQAQALGYKHDASKVDKAKFKTYQPGQLCSSCAHFQAKGNEEWAPCAIFAGKQVAAKGWCAAWQKKT